MRALFVACCVLHSAVVFAAPLTWSEVAPGLHYAKRRVEAAHGPGQLHVFRIDPGRYRLDILLAKDGGQKTAAVRDMGIQARALLAVNGGFFSPALDPLGLRIQAGKERVPLKATNWWGIFFTTASHIPRIAGRQGFTPTNDIYMAIQSGPRLVIDGAIPGLGTGTAERSAMGITRRGDVVIAVTEHSPITLPALAEILRGRAADGGLECRNALNLDGGGSTQLYVNLKKLRVDIAGLTPVTDAVAIFPR